MSDDPRDGLAVVTADCLPILFWDARTGAAAAAHCGWKGTRLRLAERVVQAMTLRFGSRAGDLWVGIGPGIAGGCYQVGEEVIEAFRTAGFSGSVARPDLEGRWRLDLVAANREALRGAGVHEDRIRVDGACTHCDAERFYSYRRDMTSRRHWAGVRPGPR